MPDTTSLLYVARSVLCIPAASAMSESNFSSAGTVLCKTRNALNPSMPNDLLTVRSNADLI
ncbi:hypothetical protein PF005_g20346 [Phytophthora fragariae]|uniref:HAT C-terminal dimerisation domain-containing protein n=1 Tax=Phytophthora fragariae TaxID=53985 RepID=A0A6A3SDA2_9STRA|nr:hypothetical protein PF003_g14421 [Phytophthora fragariae]KAE8935542.1 hypothetical protein PF009_g14527 [Phytophthora fragariae]KAE9001057.1 hypothetical protein PF011_g13911 [Phytophthora fragariae]KAE9087290.1 hypothetical protein PF007_g20429 [Phytophthora fragariae]KAE9087356.1 hypothetical protein PF010_g19762 [Phytophthora fragariae]